MQQCYNDIITDIVVSD